MNPQISYLLNLSIQNIQNRRLDAAEFALKQVIKLQPKNPDALGFLSVVFAYRYQYQEALKWIEKSLEVAPKNGIAHNNKGNILKELGRYAESILSYDRAMALEPSFVEPYSNKGNVLQELGEFSKSLSCYDKAISLDPSYVEAYCNKANALTELGFYDDAQNCFDKAISIKSDYAEAWSNKGLMLLKIKLYSRALECFDRATEINPKRTESWVCKGRFFNEVGLFDDALICFNRAIELSPQNALAWGGKAFSLSEIKEYQLAIECYKTALTINPELEFTLGFLISTQLSIADWKNSEQSIKLLTQRATESKRDIVPFSALSVLDEPSFHLKIAKIWAKDKLPHINTLPPVGKWEHRRIRVAYFSADFHGQHPVGLLTPELFEYHNRNQFEVYAFSLKKAPDEDLHRRRLENSFDHFINIENKSGVEIAELSRKMEIDIAVDLGGYTKDAAIEAMSCRAAPIQVNYLGYPGTLGAEFMDYIIADKILIPTSSQQYYSEKVVYLPDSYMIDDSKRVPLQKSISRLDYGLPEDKFIYCCFNNGYKFNKKILELWARILLQTKNSILWISDNNINFKNNLIQEFEKLGIEPNRIFFAKRVDSMAEHLARYSLADLFLDTHPYNAHTTGLDSLKAGVPIITCIGKAFAGRVGASLLNAIGLPELAVNSFERYEKLAIELAREPEKLQLLKKKLAENRDTKPLFDTRLTVMSIEKAYEEMYRKYLTGEENDHIFVDNR